MSDLARRYYLRGREALARGDLELAEDRLRAALELVPAFAPARIAYAAALSRQGERGRAPAVLRAGIARAETNRAEASLYAALGDALIAASDLESASEAYSQCEALRPALASRAAGGRAQALAKLGRYRESIAELTRAAKLSRPK